MIKVYGILLISLGLFTLGCTSVDDKESKNDLDPIIGNWHLLSFSTIENGVEVKDELSSCEKNTRLVLSAEGTLASTSYIEEEEGCVIEDKTEGTWKNLAGGVYQLTISGEIISEEITLKADLLTIREEIADEELTYITLLRRVN